MLEFSCHMPLQFHMLCKLTQIEPRKIPYDFMCNVGMETYGLGDQQRYKAMEYDLQCGYGQNHYTLDDMRRIFKEMEAISGLFPNNSKEKLLDIHANWRKEYYKFWFNKWYRKYRRSDSRKTVP